MNKASLERAFIASLTFMLVLATLDLILYTWLGTAVLTVASHTISFWFFLRYRLMFDLVKLLETSALTVDLYLISQHGYAIASPVAALLIIIFISLNKEHHFSKLKNDLNKVFATKKQEAGNSRSEAGTPESEEKSKTEH